MCDSDQFQCNSCGGWIYGGDSYRFCPHCGVKL